MPPRRSAHDMEIYKYVLVGGEYGQLRMLRSVEAIPLKKRALLKVRAPYDDPMCRKKRKILRQDRFLTRHMLGEAKKYM